MANFLDLFSNPSISKIVIIAAVVGVLVSLCASLLGVTLVLKSASTIITDGEYVYVNITAITSSNESVSLPIYSKVLEGIVVSCFFWEITGFSNIFTYFK